MAMKAGNFLSSWATASLSRRPLFYGVGFKLQWVWFWSNASLWTLDMSVCVVLKVECGGGGTTKIQVTYTPNVFFIRHVTTFEIIFKRTRSACPGSW